MPFIIIIMIIIIIALAIALAYRANVTSQNVATKIDLMGTEY